MRRVARAPWLCMAALAAVAGCAQNSYVVQGQLQTLQQQHAELTQRYAELQSRMTPLDQDNAEQATLLAQSQQQRRVLEEQVAALREQLNTVTSQLAKTRDEHQLVEKKAATLAASVKRRVGATITANNSLQERLPAVDIPGVEVRPDGDVIRIDIERGRCDALVSDEEIARRRKQPPPPIPESQTPWQELFRATTGQLDKGAVMELAVKYRGVAAKTPRHNH